MVAVIGALVSIATVVSCNRQSNSPKQTAVATAPSSNEPKSAESSLQEEPPLPKLPEKEPPAGLPIVPWGKRGHFPVIRKPQYLTAEQGDRALARDEPVLGLVIGKEARAYSTNQLNDHEMVVETIAGTPVLVTY
jgi:hypothetical protein